MKRRYGELPQFVESALFPATFFFMHHGDGPFPIRTYHNLTGFPSINAQIVEVRTSLQISDFPI
jgi:hypothetical protein